MTRLQSRGPASMALLVALIMSQTTIAQAPSTSIGRPLKSSQPDSVERPYKIYSLSDFASDPGMCEWIAQTIPEVIAAGTGKGAGVIRYYPAKNVLVVCHTSEAQTLVDSFLKDLRKAASEGTKTKTATPRGPASDPEVLPTVYRTPVLRKGSPSKPTPESSHSYPVPAPTKAPKHLFHFIIRYEGEGIIDDSVVKALKDYYRAEMKANPTAAAVTPSSPPSVGCVPASATVEPPPAAEMHSLNLAPASVSGETSTVVAPTPSVKGKKAKKGNKDTEKMKQTR